MSYSDIKFHKPHSLAFYIMLATGVFAALNLGSILLLFFRG